MLDLVTAAADLQAQIDGLGIPNCVIGGLALQAWGEVRVTRDADFTVLTGFEDEAAKARAILDLLTPRRPDALEFAIRNRVLLGFVKGSIAVDIGLGGFDFEIRAVARAVRFEMGPSVWLRICGAEDLVVMKAFAGRDRDWADLAGIVARRGPALDWALIEAELVPLLDLAGAPQRLHRLQELRD